MLEGRNAVTEALSAGGRSISSSVADGDTDRALGASARWQSEAGAVVVPTDRRKLDYMSATGAHQGVIAMVAAHDYASIDDILKKAQDAGRTLLIVICDELSDPA
ncbi:MAG: RNA methyltransferase substrate-binding domain-containing protein [Oscillospiraceae bacterium]